MHFASFFYSMRTSSALAMCFIICVLCGFFVGEKSYLNLLQTMKVSDTLSNVPKGVSLHDIPLKQKQPVARDQQDPVNMQPQEAKEFCVNDLDRNHSSCGNSISNPAYGWIFAEDLPFYILLGVGGSNNLTIGDAMIKGWELARDLESSYGIHHFLEGAPFILEQLSNDQKRIIKKIVKGCYRFKARFPLQRIAIQKVRVAPSLCVDLHYTQDEIRKTRNEDNIRTVCDAATSFSDHDAGFNRTAFIEM